MLYKLSGHFHDCLLLFLRHHGCHVNFFSINFCNKNMLQIHHLSLNYAILIVLVDLSYYCLV
nr:MAG TPA: hypothetical protein [Caudoviricetes sp.]